jgi:hypothetical protein
MIRRFSTHRAIALFAVLLVLLPRSNPVFASAIVAVSGTVNQSGIVAPSATAIANPPGSDETQGVLEIDLDALRSLVPGSVFGEASLGIVVQFGVAKTLEVRTYAGDLELNELDFGGGGSEAPLISYVAAQPTGPEGLTLTLDLTPDDLIQDVIGFNLRESESSGNVVGLEYLLLATLVALSSIVGVVVLRETGIPQIGPDGLPTGEYLFGPPEVTLTLVPEPTSAVLLLCGVVFALVLFRRRHGV